MSRIDDQDGRNAMLRAGRYEIALTQISELVGLDTKDPNWDPADPVEAVRNLVDSVEAVRNLVEKYERAQLHAMTETAKRDEPAPLWTVLLFLLLTAVSFWLIAQGFSLWQ